MSKNAFLVESSVRDCRVHGTWSDQLRHCVQPDWHGESPTSHLTLTLSITLLQWAVGVISYILLSGYSPFLGDSDMETFNHITR